MNETMWYIVRNDMTVLCGLYCSNYEWSTDWADTRRRNKAIGFKTKRAALKVIDWLASQDRRLALVKFCY